MSEQKGMRIIQLHAENVKRIRAITITPDGDIVEIAGANGQGKSSTLDAIALALEGGAFRVEEPVRIGEEKGSVRVVIGEPDDPSTQIVVTRSWTQGGEKTALKIETADGALLKTPQAVLDKLVGTVAFDPLRFAKSKPAERRAEMLRLVPIAGDLTQLDGRRLKAFTDRTDVTRELKKAEGALALLPVEPGELEVEPSVSALVGEMEAAQAQQRAIDAQAGEVRRLDAEGAAAGLLVDRLREELAAAEAKLAGICAEWTAAQERFAGMTIPNVEPIRNAIANAEQTAAAVRERNRRRVERTKLVEDIGIKQADHARLTLAIEAIDAGKADLLAKAPMPVAGLSISDDDVLYNGVPFGQIAASEQLRVGLKLAMSANPRLRVALLRDGSLLDDASRREVAEWAAAHDAQCWIEVVGHGDEGAWVIEDGALVGAEVETAVMS